MRTNDDLGMICGCYFNRRVKWFTIIRYCWLKSPFPSHMIKSSGIYQNSHPGSPPGWLDYLEVIVNAHEVKNLTASSPTSFPPDFSHTMHKRSNSRRCSKRKCSLDRFRIPPPRPTPINHKKETVVEYSDELEHRPVTRTVQHKGVQKTQRQGSQFWATFFLWEERISHRKVIFLIGTLTSEFSLKIEHMSVKPLQRIAILFFNSPTVSKLDPKWSLFLFFRRYEFESNDS